MSAAEPPTKSKPRATKHWSDRLRIAEREGRPLQLKPGDVKEIKHLLEYYELRTTDAVTLVCANGGRGRTYAS